MLKRRLDLVLLIFMVSLSACSSLRTREQPRGAKPAPRMTPATPGATVPPSAEVSSEDLTADEEAMPHIGAPAPTVPVPIIPKVGLILGPGGARAFAHIGVLQEFQREKIPVVGVAGIEWGAPIAALYSIKGLANEAEWQMSKLKADEVRKTSFIGGSAGPGDVRALGDFLKLAFGRAKAEDGKLPFSCASHNLFKNQVYLMSRGSFDQLLPYCLAYPPAFRPYQGNVAAVREVKLLADQLRAKGATHIVVVNVLPAPNPSKPVAGSEGGAESVLWNEISALYAKPIPGVDHILSVPVGNTPLMAFDQQRDLLQKGSEGGAPLVKQLARRLGL